MAVKTKHAQQPKRDVPKRTDYLSTVPAGSNEPCAPGSIEQQLDMCEGKGPRGDDVLHNHGRDEDAPIGVEDNFQFNMAEPDREGDEMSGDEHSSGLQGGEPENLYQPHFDSGTPGEETEDTAKNVQELNKRRLA